MKKHQLEMFCTAGDFVSLLEKVQKEASVFFAVAGMSESVTVRRFDAPADISSFITGSSDTAVSFLALGREDAVRVEKVPQRRGGTRYAVDQFHNPRSVVVRPGRSVDERTLLAGQIGTASEDPASVKLFHAFRDVVRKRFVKVKSYWVGPEALRLLDGGGRLAATLKAPPEYALKR